MWGTIRAGRTWSGRLVNRRKDGTLYTETATISPVRDASGVITNYIAVKRDISERLNSKRSSSKLRRWSPSVAWRGGVAHDFNNILGIIIGYADLALESEDLTDRLTHDLSEILEAARRSKEIVRQLLAFARKQTASPEVLDLNESIEGTLKMLRRLIGEEIELTWRPGSGLGPVKIDPSQLDQIWPICASTPKTPSQASAPFTIGTEAARLDGRFCASHPESNPGDYVVLKVSDTGCGIDEQALGNIFEPFYTTKGPAGGPGWACPPYTESPNRTTGSPWSTASSTSVRPSRSTCHGTPGRQGWSLTTVRALPHGRRRAHPRRRR